VHANVAWKSGLREASRGGASAATTASNGSPWCSKASSARVRTRSTSSVKRGAPTQVGAQHDHVDEEPDHRLEVGPLARRDRHAHGNVVPAAEPVQQHVERGGQRHERCRAKAPRQRPERERKLRVDRERKARTGVVRHRRARPVGRKVEGRHAVERAAPMVERRAHRLAAQRVRLLASRSPRTARGGSGTAAGAGRKRRVAVRDLAQHHDRRPAVVTMWWTTTRAIARRREAQEPRAQQRPALEVEAGRALAMRARAGDVVAARVRDRRLVVERQRELERPSRCAARFARGTSKRVRSAAWRRNDVVEGAREQGRVERAFVRAARRARCRATRPGTSGRGATAAPARRKPGPCARPSGANRRTPSATAT
jgi:hypothetical protein